MKFSTSLKFPALQYKNNLEKTETFTLEGGKMQGMKQRKIFSQNNFSGCC